MDTRLSYHIVTSIHVLLKPLTYPATVLHSFINQSLSLMWLIIHPSFFFTEIAKQHVSETQSLLNREAQHVSYQHKDLHQKKEATKERTQAVLAGRQKVNEMTKKFMKTE